MLGIPCPKCKSTNIESIDAVYYKEKQTNSNHFKERLEPPTRPMIDENFGDRYMVRLKRETLSRVIFVSVLGISMLFFSFLNVIVNAVISIVIAFVVTMKFQDHLGDPLENYLKERKQALDCWQKDIKSRESRFICLSCESIIEIVSED